MNLAAGVNIGEPARDLIKNDEAVLTAIRPILVRCPGADITPGNELLHQPDDTLLRFHDVVEMGDMA